MAKHLQISFLNKSMSIKFRTMRDGKNNKKFRVAATQRSLSRCIVVSMKCGTQQRCSLHGAWRTTDQVVEFYSRFRL
jgi:hypothetical protein